MTQRNRNSGKKRKMPANYHPRTKQQILLDQAAYERARQKEQRMNDIGNFAILVTTCVVIGGTTVWCGIQLARVFGIPL